MIRITHWNTIRLSPPTGVTVHLPKRVTDRMSEQIFSIYRFKKIQITEKNQMNQIAV